MKAIRALLLAEIVATATVFAIPPVKHVWEQWADYWGYTSSMIAVCAGC